jgi:hypothetical protein
VPYTNVIREAKGNICSPLKDLGINLEKRGHYVGILVSRDDKALTSANGNQHYATLKVGIVPGDGPLALALPKQQDTFRKPFEGRKKPTEATQNGKRPQTRGESSGGRESKRSKLGRRNRAVTK